MFTKTPSGRYFPLAASVEQNVRISQLLSETDGTFYGFIIVVNEDVATVAWNMDGLPYGVEYRAELLQNFLALTSMLTEDNLVDFAVYTINCYMEGLDHM